MTTYKYKSKNGKEFFIPGIGQSKDGVIVSDRALENPNLELVSEDSSEQSAPAAPAAPVQSTAQPQVAAPGAVIGVAPQATQPAAAPQAPNTESN